MILLLNLSERNKNSYSNPQDVFMTSHKIEFQSTRQTFIFDFHKKVYCSPRKYYYNEFIRRWSYYHSLTIYRELSVNKTFRRFKNTKKSFSWNGCVNYMYSNMCYNTTRVLYIKKNTKTEWLKRVVSAPRLFVGEETFVCLHVHVHVYEYKMSLIPNFTNICRRTERKQDFTHHNRLKTLH